MRKLLGLACGESLLTFVVFKEIANVWCQWEEKRELHLNGPALPTCATPSSLHSAILHWLLPIVRPHARYSLYGGERERHNSSPTELTSVRGAKRPTNIKK